MRKYSVQVYKTGHEMPDNENPPASVPKGGRAGLVPPPGRGTEAAWMPACHSVAG